MLLIILLTVSSIGMFLLALFGWKRRKIVPAARFYSAFMLAVALYCGGYAAQISCGSISCMHSASRFEYLGVSCIPAAWVLLSLCYSGITARFSRVLVFVLLVLAALTFGFFISNSIFLSLTQDKALFVTSAGFFPLLVFYRDPWYLICCFYIITAILAGNIVFLSTIFRSPPHLRLQSTTMFLGSLLPWGGLAVYLDGQFAPGFDPLPIAFSVSGIFFLLGLFRFRLVNLAPMVRSVLVEDLTDGMLFFNRNGRLLDLNRTAVKLLDMPKQEAIGAFRDQLLAGYPKLREVIVEGGGPVDEWGQKVTGRRLTAQVTVTPLRGRWLRYAGSLVLIHDISGLKKAESDLRDSEEKFRLLFEAAPDPILLMDESGRCIDCNNAAIQVFGVASRGNVLHRSLSFFSPEYQPDGELSSDKETDVARLAFVEGTSLSEWAFRHQDGSLVIVDLSIAIISIKGKKVQLIHLRDITEKKYVEQKLRDISLTDELTGLHNRRGFMTLALQQIKIADRLAQGMTLLYADLDDLKGINDTYGHLAGDQALTDAAAVLKTSLRASDILARLGGDEFVGLILESGGETEQAVKARIQENLNAHNLQRIRPYRLSFSIGTARYEVTAPCSVEELLEGADREMYRNKIEKKSSQEKCSL